MTLLTAATQQQQQHIGSERPFPGQPVIWHDWPSPSQLIDRWETAVLRFVFFVTYLSWNLDFILFIYFLKNYSFQTKKKKTIRTSGKFSSTIFRFCASMHHTEWPTKRSPSGVGLFLSFLSFDIVFHCLPARGAKEIAVLVRLLTRARPLLWLFHSPLSFSIVLFFTTALFWVPWRMKSLK